MKTRNYKESGCSRLCGLWCLLCCGGGQRHRGLKAVAGCVFGILLGVAFYLVILLDMEMGVGATLVLGGMTTLLLAVGNASSDYIRCVCLLTVPAACGRTGRSVLKTFALALVLSGPLANLALNAREVVRVFGCTSQLTYNLTKTKYQILLKPFQEALIGMRHDEQLILDTLDTVQDVVEPLVEEVEGQEEVDFLREETDFIDAAEGDSPRSREIEKRYTELRERRKRARNGTEDEAEVFEMEYKRKVEYRCQGVINEGTAKCQALFQKSYDSCYDAVSFLVAWLLCWPMKLTFMCNLISIFGGKSMCDPSHVVEPGFGKGYATVKNSKNIFSENLGNVKIKYVMKGTFPKVDGRGVYEAANAALKEFNKNKSWFDVVSLTLKRLFALVFLFVIYKAAKYQEKYVTDLNFDNKYITAYFRKVDLRQREGGHRWLLPLKRKEARYFVNPYAMLPDRAATCRIMKLTLLLVLEMLPVTLFFTMDFLLYTILDIIATHAHVEFTQKGEHHMTVKVTGGGLVANLVRSLVRDMNVHQSVHVIHSNVTCLPRPALIERYFVLKVYGIYFLVWVLILADGYSGRLNRFICSHFYPKREKRRVLYLYNETLRRRIRQHAHVMARIRKQAEENRLKMEGNWCLSLRFRRPRSFGWLHWLSCARRDCLFCGEIEPARLGNKFYACPTPGCLTIHCLQCWKEVGNICYGCEEDEDDGEVDEGEEEEEEFSEEALSV